MADETIIDKAVALIPGMGASKTKKTTPVQRHKQLQAIQKKLATLAKDVEALAAHVAEEAKAALGSKPAAAKGTARKAPAKTPPAKKATTAKAAPAKAPATTKKPAAAPKKKPAAATKKGKAG